MSTLYDPVLYATNRRTIIFVDAGFLLRLMQAHHQVPDRSHLWIDNPTLVEQLRHTGQSQLGCPVLRIYWYDAEHASGKHPNLLAARMARVDGIRVRLGTLHLRPDGRIEQKAVDTLMVRDMIAHAYKKTAQEMILLSGDNDLVPGMEEAQEQGVRVHLWSVRGDDLPPSVGRQLADLADSRFELEAERLARSIRALPTTTESGLHIAAPTGSLASGPVANGPVANGPVASSPVANGPVASSPVANGQRALNGTSSAPDADAQPHVTTVAPGAPVVAVPSSPDSTQPASEAEPSEAAGQEAAASAGAVAAAGDVASAESSGNQTQPADGEDGVIAERPAAAHPITPADLAATLSAGPRVPTSDDNDRFPRLYDLDKSGYHLPIQEGDAEAVGIEYATRWAAAADREDIISVRRLREPGFDGNIPRSIDSDLLYFGADQGLDTYASIQKFSLRRGFWLGIEAAADAVDVPAVN